MGQIRAKTTKWIVSKTSMKIGIQSRSTVTESADSVWTATVRHLVSGQVSIVHRRQPRQSVPAHPLERHTPSGCLRRAFTPPELHISPAIVLGELRRASASSPGRTTASRAELLHPELHRNVLYLDIHLFYPSQAPERSHCQLRCELHLAGVHRDHRQRGQTSLVHLLP